MDRFIKANNDFQIENDFYMVFIDNLDEDYDEPSERPVTEASSSDSPFKGKTTQECYRLLMQLREDEADIDYGLFVIMDERSTQDDTVLIVGEPPDDESEPRSLRATFEVVQTALHCYRAGTSSVEENQDEAEAEEDGVYRMHLD